MRFGQLRRSVLGFVVGDQDLEAVDAGKTRRDRIEQRRQRSRAVLGDDNDGERRRSPFRIARDRTISFHDCQFIPHR